MLRFKGTINLVVHWTKELIPTIMTLVVFVAGAMLIFSGAMPHARYRLLGFMNYLPLSVFEVSHFLGSIVGVLFLFLARGLQRRLDAAYVLTCLFLFISGLISLLKAFSYKEAGILLTLFFILLPCRKMFYRKASLFTTNFSLGWVLAITVVFISFLVIGLFNFRFVKYSDELWWRFGMDAQAPRFLRAFLGVIIFSLCIALSKLFKTNPEQDLISVNVNLDEVYSTVTKSKSTMAYLALLGDKSFLFSDDKKSFVMYGIRDNSLVALGSPVGEENQSRELIWKFRELADKYDRWTVFTEVSVDDLSYYLDIGLSLIKLGEEALIPLDKFSLEGSTRRDIRYAVNSIDKKGVYFEILMGKDVVKNLSEFHRISDAWLKSKHTKEKGFTLGYFNEEYLKYCCVAVIKNSKNQLLAFSNLWLGYEKVELSADLVRYSPEAPKGMMDYLLGKIMLWGQSEGYKWFNMGMASLSGLENRKFAPLWNRIGDYVYHEADYFYNFEGLREYKEKFDPVWKARYLAYPGGISLLSVLADIASLTSGGLKGVFLK